MDADWTTSPSAQRVLQHDADKRPAWLWSEDGSRLIWQNRAAGLFLAKLKKHGLKLAPPAVPIKGQVARNIRLGSPGRTSLARIQFLAGDKPTSSTCATTPLHWQDGRAVLLIVGVDPIDDDIFAAAAAREASQSDGQATVTSAAPSDATASFVPVSVTAARPDGDAPFAPNAPNDGEDPGAAEGESREPTLPEAEPRPDADDSAYAQDLDSWRAAETEPMQGLSPADVLHDESTPEADPDSVSNRLSRLVDRMAADTALYAPLTEADDNFVAGPLDERALPPADDTAPQSPGLFKVTGRGFIADANADQDADADASDAETEATAEIAELSRLDAPAPADDGAAAPLDAAERLSAALAEIAPPPTSDPEVVERVSRYNFDELSRILNDRVGEAAPATLPAAPQEQRGAALISLGGETLVLNRLPLGILVFRDQQVLFANRAITEMVGYDSVESLRQAGLAAVFPAAGPEGQEAGPVNHLVQRDGTLVPVTARLQSISWHGRPALMLSASTTEVRTGHEGAVNAFAQAMAEIRGDGFFEATRAGVISRLTTKAATLLGQSGMLEGKPLSGLVASSDVAALREFLDRPARFAETVRPWLKLQAAVGRAEVTLFAQGQAGVVTGYFGLVRGREAPPARLSGPSDADPALLGRISRGIRRPLNSIIGFADLMGESAGQADSAQLLGYARDISAAGQDIAALVDELDDYARLRDGRYLPQRASVDLTELLEGCILRIRQQASNARVFVRNAISESLPRLIADRASLEQAVLNLLASAIDQSPNGGAVVISAQLEDNGGIAVHVRDSSVNAVDMAERFVVFRDGPGRDGKMRAPVRSSVGLALTRSLLAVNAFSLSVDPAGEQGMLFTLKIPADQVERQNKADIAE